MLVDWEVDMNDDLRVIKNPQEACEGVACRIIQHERVFL